VGKTKVICVTFLHDVACQKLLKSAHVSWSYSNNNTSTVFLRHGVDVVHMGNTNRVTPRMKSRTDE